MTCAIGAAGILALITAAVIARTTLFLVTVRGSSMSPTNVDGDRC